MERQATRTSNEERVAIRRYGATDAAACRLCIAELQEAERRFDSRLRRGDEIADEYLQQMHDRCRQYTGTILVAESGRHVVGLAMILTRVPFESLDEPPGSYAVVAELIVRAGFRGRGIGAALLRESERYAGEAGAAELRINVMSANHTARRLYAREGFAPYLEILSKPLLRDRVR